jgi:hypothetical protein
MRQTVVGVFDLQDAAQAAVTTLADERFDPSRVHAVETATIPTLTDIAVPAEVDTSVLSQLRHFLAANFHSAHATLLFDGMERRGNAVVSVEVDDQPQAVRAELAFVKAGAIDITRRNSH